MSESPEELTLRWLTQVVVGLNLCPFAKRELDSGRIRIVTTSDGDTESYLRELTKECQILDNDEEVATTLLVYDTSLASFDEYLDYLAMAEELLHLEGYEGVYQLASFHPDYRFADESQVDDAANYTNRSPYPMLHLIREEDVARAVASHPDPAQIPVRNKRVCRELGIPALSALLKAKP